MTEKKFQKAAKQVFTRNDEEAAVMRKRRKDLSATELRIYNRVRKRESVARIVATKGGKKKLLERGRDWQRRFRASLERLGTAKTFYKKQNDAQRARKLAKLKSATLVP